MAQAMVDAADKLEGGWKVCTRQQQLTAGRDATASSGSYILLTYLRLLGYIWFPMAHHHKRTTSQPSRWRTAQVMKENKYQTVYKTKAGPEGETKVYYIKTKPVRNRSCICLRRRADALP